MRCIFKHPLTITIAYANIVNKSILYGYRGVLMSFVDFVKEVRVNMKMSQHKFAEAINVNYTTLNRWEKSKIVPSRLARKSFFEYCRLNDIDVPNEILEGSELL